MRRRLSSLERASQAMAGRGSRGYSSVGRARRSQRRGRGFESPYLHQAATGVGAAESQHCGRRHRRCSAAEGADAATWRRTYPHPQPFSVGAHLGRAHEGGGFRRDAVALASACGARPSIAVNSGEPPVAQGIEQWFPKPCAQVRFLPGGPARGAARRPLSLPGSGDLLLLEMGDHVPAHEIHGVNDLLGLEPADPRPANHVAGRRLPPVYLI